MIPFPKAAGNEQMAFKMQLISLEVLNVEMSSSWLFETIFMEDISLEQQAPNTCSNKYIVKSTCRS